MEGNFSGPRCSLVGRDEHEVTSDVRIFLGMETESRVGESRCSVCPDVLLGQRLHELKARQLPRRIRDSHKWHSLNSEMRVVRGGNLSLA